jgi:L-alanine-DL-glutamate epimerase-like enolase superfamily enzyme
VRVTLTQLSRPLRSPFLTADGALESRRLLVLGVQDRDGNVGFGECAPLRAPFERAAAALGRYLPVLESAAGTEPPARLLAACARAAGLPEALAAVDLALWDLAGRRAGQPVWRLLGARDTGPVTVNATIAAVEPGQAGTLAAAARERGFRAVKVKVGSGDDAGRVAAVRDAAGERIAIRLDANGAWTVAGARAALRALAPAEIELCEEPVHGLARIAALAGGCPVPIAIDETAAAPRALERRVCQAVCLRVAGCGGISGLLAAWRAARRAGYEVYLASGLDGPLTIAAALHACAVIKPRRACGLATLGLFAASPDPLLPRSGTLSPPDGAGLGQGLLDWYRPADLKGGFHRADKW